MSLREQLVADLEHMEDAAAMTAGRSDIICVALVHLLRMAIKKEDR